MLATTLALARRLALMLVVGISVVTTIRLA
jgi:hypothetical protein